MAPWEYSSVNSITRKDTDPRCPYLTSGEDYHKTTIFPKCGCNCQHCSEYSGYCPVRD